MTKSERVSSSSSSRSSTDWTGDSPPLEVRYGSWAMTFISRPSARLAATCPILPSPMTPRVLPVSSVPISPFFFQFPVRVRRSALGMCLESEQISEIASSAVVTVFPRGVFMTMTPLSVAACRSTLSMPTPARPMTRSSSAASITRRVTLVAERTTMACAPGVGVTSSSSESPVQTSGEKPFARKVSTAISESSSQMRMRVSLGASRWVEGVIGVVDQVAVRCRRGRGWRESAADRRAY